LLTRLPNAVVMGSPIAVKMWQGIRDGFSMPILTHGR
jgi:hypothetical protein